MRRTKLCSQVRVSKSSDGFVGTGCLYLTFSFLGDSRTHVNQITVIRLCCRLAAFAGYLGSIIRAVLFFGAGRSFARLRGTVSARTQQRINYAKNQTGKVFRINVDENKGANRAWTHTRRWKLSRKQVNHMYRVSVFEFRCKIEFPDSLGRIHQTLVRKEAFH